MWFKCDADGRDSFGAVLEEFEVSDALMTVLAGKFSNGNPTPA
jgi:hypothetical protein